MPAGEGLQSPLKAQPFSGLAASTGARCGPTAASQRDLRSQVHLLGATAEGDTCTGCSGTTPGHIPGLCGIVAERGGSEQH